MWARTMRVFGGGHKLATGAQGRCVAEQQGFPGRLLVMGVGGGGRGAKKNPATTNRPAHHLPSSRHKHLGEAAAGGRCCQGQHTPFAAPAHPPALPTPAQPGVTHSYRSASKLGLTSASWQLETTTSGVATAPAQAAAGCRSGTAAADGREVLAGAQQAGGAPGLTRPHDGCLVEGQPAQQHACTIGWGGGGGRSWVGGVGLVGWG